MNCFRVSLIGTGGGYGESVVVQLGANNWMVVDSCQDPVTKESLPLRYLKSLKVNVDSDVKLIVCSHWHNDHILGMENLLDECKSASFALAITSDKEKFLEFIELESRQDKLLAKTSSTNIMARCLQIARERKTPVKTIFQDRLLFNLNEKNLEVKVFALSPSDTVIAEFGKELSELMKDFVPNSNNKIIVRSPNEKCVVLQTYVNGHSVILGGDLETSSDNEHGWLCILDNSQCILKNKSSLFKIPHHGSENAYEERVWKELFDNDKLIGQLSPFMHGKVCLPTSEMLAKFIKMVKHLYITSYDKQVKPKKREKSLEKAIQKFNPTLKELQYREGIIENLIDLDNDDGEWKTKLHGNAFKIDSKFIDGL